MTRQSQDRPPIDGTPLGSRLRRAYREFLHIPTLMLGALLLMAIGALWLDRNDVPWLAGVKDLVRSTVFGGELEATDFLGMLTTGLISLTSITFSMLLVALQQSASRIGTQVVNSFLLRHRNQVLLGFMLGATIAVVVLRAATTPDEAVLASLLALVLAIVAVYSLLILLYAAINQTRPQAVLEEVRGLTLRARRAQADLLRSTRREPVFTDGIERVVRAEHDHGYLRNIRLDPLLDALEATDGRAEIELRAEVGTYVAYGEELARIRGEREDEVERLAATARDALVLDRQRATSVDPSFGIEQIQRSGWSSGSTAFQDPGVALESLRNLRDIISRWTAEYEEEAGGPDRPPLVYPDGLLERALDAVESVGVISTESLQSTTMEEVLRVYHHLFPVLPAHLQKHVEAALGRLLTGLGDHVLTHPLEREIQRLIEVLRHGGASDTADRLDAARSEMLGISGELAARSTRARKANPDAGS